MGLPLSNNPSSQKCLLNCYSVPGKVLGNELAWFYGLSGLRVSTRDSLRKSTTIFSRMSIPFGFYSTEGREVSGSVFDYKKEVSSSSI